MSQAEDLLNSIQADNEISLYTSDPQTEGYIVVDSNRFITVPEELKRIAVANDHNIETVTFECPRYWDGHDLSIMQLYINYRSPDESLGCYVVNNVSIDENDSNIMHFDWTITRNVAKSEGKVIFLVCAKKVDENGNETLHWNSELCEDMYVSEGLECDEVLEEEELPIKYAGYTPCYRKEAGSYRTEERGMIRGYQFNKVEMVEYTKEDDSDRAFEELVNKAKALIEGLGLHYRVSKLAAGDCSHSMARTYDIEVYLPSIDIYKEVSSVSNARSYQARRGMMRYRDENGKLHYMHTLNGSGLATSRVFPAILEQYQQEDGSVVIPEVLRPYMGGIEVIKPIKK